jgi:nucleoside 2-deoxyribosyltransferase
VVNSGGLEFVLRGGGANVQVSDGFFDHPLRDAGLEALRFFARAIDAANSPQAREIMRASFLAMVRGSSLLHVVIGHHGGYRTLVVLDDMSAQGEPSADAITARAADQNTGAISVMHTFSLPIAEIISAPDVAAQRALDEANGLLGRLKGARPVSNDEVPDDIREAVREFHDEHGEGPTCFLMMSFAPSPMHQQITAAIREALEARGIKAVRADDRTYSEELFTNIRTYLHACTFGIAVIERIEKNDHNPNVSLEAGYMMGRGKQVCYLKERTVTQLQTDLVGRLYNEFDQQRIEETIPQILNRWLDDRGRKALRVGRRSPRSDPGPQPPTLERSSGAPTSMAHSQAQHIEDPIADLASTISLGAPKWWCGPGMRMWTSGKYDAILVSESGRGWRIRIDERDGNGVLREAPREQLLWNYEEATFVGLNEPLAIASEAKALLRERLRRATPFFLRQPRADTEQRLLDMICDHVVGTGFGDAPGMSLRLELGMDEEDFAPILARLAHRYVDATDYADSDQYTPTAMGIFQSHYGERAQRVFGNVLEAIKNNVRDLARFKHLQWSQVRDINPDLTDQDTKISGYVLHDLGVATSAWSSQGKGDHGIGLTGGRPLEMAAKCTSAEAFFALCAAGKIKQPWPTCPSHPDFDP